MTDEPTIADTVRHAASELRALAARAEHKDRSVMLDPPECRAIAGLLDAIVTEAEAALVFTGIDPRAVNSASVWAATATAARALLGEA